MKSTRRLRFYCVTDDCLEATNAALAAACAGRGVQFAAVHPDRFVDEPRRVLRAGDMLYRAATGLVADRVEKQLWRPGVAAFYETPFFECTSQPIWLARSGVAMPRTAHTLPKDPRAVEGLVKRLGGLPVVVKVPGGEGGEGVIRVDSLPALFSLLDYAPPSAVMMEFFEHVVAHRLVVVGERVVAAEARHPGAYDFRSNAAGAGLIGNVRPSRRAAGLALRAARALRLEFGGADILEDARGRMVLAELNFPCYFADQQADSGIDIAGAMLDHLMAKARRLARCR